MSRVERQPDYLIVAYIVVPTTILILLLLLLYVTCSKRFRLNWYERFLLEEKSSDKKFSEAKNIKLPPKASVTNVLSAIGVGKERRYSKVHFKTEWMPVSRKMGSSPSSPTRDVSEKFWVPPAVLERKRAQSLVPTVPHHDSDDEGSSGNVTPGSVSGFRDSSSSFTFANDGLPPLPSQRQRRASMQDAIDLKKIDAKLYDRKQLCRQHSLTSNEEENLGAINCSLQYNKETHLLSVNIIQAEDLVACDVISGTSNPYCKVSLLPDHKSQLQTRVHKRTLAPKFDEEFIFDISPSKLPNCYLEILVFNYDQFSTHDCIGQVKIALLDSLNLTDKVVMWKGISPYQEEGNKSKDVGEIMFSLSYLSSAERLTVVVMKARNLKLAADESKLLDPYVKVSILCDGKRIKKKKTSTVHVTHEPVWNEALVFNIGKELLKRLSAEFQIFHDNTIGNDELVGRVKIGYDALGDGKIHWNDLMASNSAVPRWHELQE